MKKLLLLALTLCSLPAVVPAQPGPPPTTAYTRKLLKATSATNFYALAGIQSTNQTTVTNWVTLPDTGSVTPASLATTTLTLITNAASSLAGSGSLATGKNSGLLDSTNYLNLQDLFYESDKQSPLKMGLLVLYGTYAQAQAAGLQGSCFTNEVGFRYAADCMTDPTNAFYPVIKKGGFFFHFDDPWTAYTRAGDGSIRADPQFFPSGFKAMVDYLHSKGILVKVYTEAGAGTSIAGPGGQNGILGHEAQDAQTFIDWGVDGINLDYATTNPEQLAAAKLFITEFRRRSLKPMFIEGSLGQDYDVGNMFYYFNQTRGYNGDNADVNSLLYFYMTNIVQCSRLHRFSGGLNCQTAKNSLASVVLGTVATITDMPSGGINQAYYNKYVTNELYLRIWYDTTANSKTAYIGSDYRVYEKPLSGDARAVVIWNDKYVDSGTATATKGSTTIYGNGAADWTTVTAGNIFAWPSYPVAYTINSCSYVGARSRWEAVLSSPYTGGVNDGDTTTAIYKIHQPNSVIISNSTFGWRGNYNVTDVFAQTNTVMSATQNFTNTLAPHLGGATLLYVTPTVATNFIDPGGTTIGITNTDGSIYTFQNGRLTSYGGPIFSPTNVSGLTLWYSADSTNYTDYTATNWPPVTVGGVTYGQAATNVAGARPVYTNNAVCGKPAYWFDYDEPNQGVSYPVAGGSGTHIWLKTGYKGTDSAFTVFIVGRVNKHNTQPGYIYAFPVSKGHTTPSSPYTFQVCSTPFNDSWTIQSLNFVGTGWVGNQSYITNLSGQNTSPFVVAHVRNGTSVTSYLNGNSHTNTITWSNALNSDELGIGADAATGGVSCLMFISEVVYYNTALSPADVNKLISNYFKHPSKYGNTLQ